MSKILKFIDIYGEELKFKIDNKETIQSVSGGILTLATCFIVVLVAYFLGQDVFYRQLPISSTENSRFEIAPNITLNKTNYPLAFGLVDINNYPFYNESLITINAYKYLTKMNSDRLSNLTRTLYQLKNVNWKVSLIKQINVL